MVILFTARVQPFDTIWVIGEDFVENSIRRCFIQLKPDDTFTHTKFGIRAFASKSINSGFRTTIARVRNCLANALSEIVTPLPKIIFVMLEDDVIKDVKDNNGLPHIYGRCVEWLHHEIRKLLAAHNDLLPQNARRETYVTWVLPSRHMNYSNDGKRELFADCIESVVELHNERSFAMGIKQNWDPYDPSIYLYECQRFTSEGLSRLWRAFDRTVWYANVWVNKTEHRKVTEMNNQRANASNFPSERGHFRRGGRRQRGGYHSYYGNKSYYTKFGKSKSFSKLPPPPEN